MRIAAFLLSFLALPLLPVAAWAQSESISIEQNTSQLLRLSAPAATLAVGRSSIADVTLENESLLWLHGVSPGWTNLIVLDAKGGEIFSADIEVTVRPEPPEPPSPPAEYLFLHRATADTSIYDCRTSRCVPKLEQEEEEPGVDSLLQQLQQLPIHLSEGIDDN